MKYLKLYEEFEMLGNIASSMTSGILKTVSSPFKNLLKILDLLPDRAEDKDEYIEAAHVSGLDFMPNFGNTGTVWKKTGKEELVSFNPSNKNPRCPDEDWKIFHSSGILPVIENGKVKYIQLESEDGDLSWGVICYNLDSGFSDFGNSSRTPKPYYELSKSELDKLDTLMVLLSGSGYEESKYQFQNYQDLALGSDDSVDSSSPAHGKPAYSKMNSFTKAFLM